jgi:hypothetical protein
MLQVGHRLAQETGWMVMDLLPWIISSGCYEETGTCHNASPSRGAVSGINIKLGCKCQCRFKEIELRPQAVAQTLSTRAAFADGLPH